MDEDEKELGSSMDYSAVGSGAASEATRQHTWSPSPKHTGGSGVGETVALDAAARSVMVEASVRSISPLTRVWLVQDGVDVQEIPLSTDRRSATFQGELPVDKSGWIHLRAEGDPEERFPLDASYAQAFTNPVWITVGDRPVRDADAADYGLTWIDELQRQAKAWRGWRSDAEQDHVYAQFEAAREVYRTLKAKASHATRR